MKPSEKCKAAGLKSLAELSELTGESVQTLNNWSKNKPNIFDAVIMWAVDQKNKVPKMKINWVLAGCTVVEPGDTEQGT